MGVLELAFGVVFTVLAGVAAILALLVMCVWLLGTLRRLVAHNRAALVGERVGVERVGGKQW